MLPSMSRGLSKRIKVFLSSPGDVSEERARARLAMEELEQNPLNQSRVRFEIVDWNDHHSPVPLEAAVTPQESVEKYKGRPSECDLTVVLLWSRLGTPLPSRITREDGTRYESGTVWELEEARSAGKPIWIYRRTETPQIGLDADQTELDSMRAQYRAVGGFFDGFRSPDGSLAGGFHEYPEPAKFADLFAKHLAMFVAQSPRTERRRPAWLTTAREALASATEGTLDEATRDAMRAHDPSTLEEYRLSRWADGAQSRHAIDTRFTPLTVLLDRGPGAQGSRLAEHSRTQPFTDLREVLAEIDAPAFVLLGPPGSGKSTLLRRLEFELARDALRAPVGSQAIAFFASLNAYEVHPGGAQTQQPREWLANEWRQRFPEMADLDRLGGAPLVLLLDALNEMPQASDDDYRRAVDRWRRFIADAARSGVRLVFSCRSADYSLPLGTDELPVPHVRIEQMDDPQVQEFLGLYSPERGPELWQQLEGTRQLDLFRSPYYLRLLVDQPGDAWRRGRAALFTGFVRSALCRELGAHNPLLLDEELFDIDDRLLINGEPCGDYELPVGVEPFAQLAFVLQERHGSRKGSQVKANIRDALPLLGERGRDRFDVGVDLQILDKQRREFTFVHQLVQEYFAARFLAESPRARLARTPWRAEEMSPSLEDELARIGDADPLPPAPTTGWEETFLFAAAMATDCDAFIAALMRENLPLAGRCAAQADVSISSALRVELQGELLARSRAPEADLRARIAAARALGELGDPRLEKRRGPHGDYLLPPFIAIPAGEYTIGSEEGDEDEKPVHAVQLEAFDIAQFTVTNAEWELFMAAGGYDDERWWESEAARRWRQGEGVADAPKQQLRELRRFYQQPGRIEQALREGRLTSRGAEQWEGLLALSDSQFEEVLAETYPEQRRTAPVWWTDPAYNHPSQPVVGICWFEAQAYCRWLSEQRGQHFELPSEAMWEAAARGSEGRRYAWGDEFDPRRCNTFETHVRGTTPAGVFPEGDAPNAIHDLTGNVWEWLADDWHSSYVGAPSDGRVWSDEPRGDRRVVRGGSWDLPRILARCACRSRLLPGYHFDNLGFRVVRVSPIRSEP